MIESITEWSRKDKADLEKFQKQQYMQNVQMLKTVCWHFQKCLSIYSESLN